MISALGFTVLCLLSFLAGWVLSPTITAAFRRLLEAPDA